MSWDNIWEEVFNNQEWGKYPGEDLIVFVARNFYKTDRKNIKILEVGCGTGANLWYLSKEGFQAYGIDGSKTAIDKAKSYLSAQGLEASLQVGDIIKLPYDDDYFDAVIDNECLYCNNTEVSKNEFTDISDGPLAGKGFVRLIDKETINNLYGEFFNVLSIDRLTRTRDNESYTIDEFNIICEKG